MLFGALLINSQQHSRSLVLLFVFQGVVCGFNLLEGLYPSGYLITPVFTLLYGPLVYFYTLSITTQTEQKINTLLLHALPAICAVFFTRYTQTIIFIGTVSQLIYFYCSYRYLNAYHNSLMQQRSDAETLKMKWLLKALLIFGVIVVFDLLRMNVQTITPIDLKMHWYLLNEILLLIMFSFLLFHTVKKTYQSHDTQEQSPETPIAPSSNDALNIEIFSNIEHIVTTQLLYQQPRLTLTDLANHLGINSKEISSAINSSTGLNFCEYINRHRVHHVQTQLDKSPANILGTKLSLIELAFEAGFNSKSTFNAVFKKETGLTPSQYKKKATQNGA